MILVFNVLISVTLQNDCDGSENQLYIKQKTCIFYIVSIQDRLVFIVNVISSANLCITGDAGAHRKHAKALSHIPKCF